MTWSDYISIASVVVSGIVGLMVANLKLFVKNEIGNAKQEILSKVDADYACEDNVRLQFKGQGREISELKKRADRHDTRLSVVERRVAPE